MRVGDIELIPVTDGTAWYDGGGAFGLVSKVIWEKLLPCDSLNRVPLELRCLLIKTPELTILVDAGMGNKITAGDLDRANIHLSRPDGWLLDSLASHGVSPDDIDIVLLTHLHSDHCGGSTRYSESGLAPTFPRAQYWVQETEWVDAHKVNERTRGTYFDINFDPLEQAKQLRLVKGNTSVTENVRLVTAPGHTQGMQIVVIESKGQAAIYLGDVAFFHWQIERLAWVAAYDLEPNTNIETKRFWQKWLLAHQALIVFQHDPLIAAGKLVRENSRFRVVPVINV